MILPSKNPRSRYWADRHGSKHGRQSFSIIWKTATAQITKNGWGSYVYNPHISPYDQVNSLNHEPLRNRRPLLHRGNTPPDRQGQRKGYACVFKTCIFTTGWCRSWRWRLAKSCQINGRTWLQRRRGNGNARWKMQLLKLYFRTPLAGSRRPC